MQFFYLTSVSGLMVYATPAPVHCKQVHWLTRSSLTAAQGITLTPTTVTRGKAS